MANNPDMMEVDEPHETVPDYDSIRAILLATTISDVEVVNGEGAPKSDQESAKNHAPAAAAVACGATRDITSSSGTPNPLLEVGATGDYYRPFRHPDDDLPKAMADHSGRRRDDRGYSNDRRQYNNNNNHNRKRRRDDREDDDGNDRRGDRPQHQRPRFTQQPGSHLKRIYLAVAESGLRNPEEEVVAIAKVLTDNYEDAFVRDLFAELTLSLIIEQPFKIPFVAAAVQYVNIDKPELVAHIFEQAGQLLMQQFANGDWTGVKLMLRFLALCQGLYTDEGVLPVLEELFNRAVDLQTASAEDTLGLELVKIILFTIPYMMASSAVGLEQQAASLLEKTGIVASATHELESVIDPYPADEDQKPMAFGNFLAMLQKQLQSESAEGWKLACIPRAFNPDAAVSGAEQSEESQPKVPTKHAFPSIVVPTTVNPGKQAPYPEIYWSLFADQDAESVPPTTNVASSLIRDTIVDTMDLLNCNRNSVAKFLVDLDCYWAPETFAKRGIPFDKLKEIPEGKSTWKPEDMVIDAVFSQIMRLPAPKHKLVYYHSVITETCRAAPHAVAPSLGRAIRFLFRNVDLMDVELVFRYTEWFAHHVSNFEFRWKWAEWAGEVDEPSLKPQKAFIVGALEKQIRLSFAKHIRELVPPVFQPFITDAQMKETPDFKFDEVKKEETEEDKTPTPYAAQGREVCALLRKKASEEEIQAVLDTVQTMASQQGVADPMVTSTDVFMTCICHIGSKSLSHVLSSIDRSKERLLAIGAASGAARRQIITSLVAYWVDHPGSAVYLIDKLLNYTILTPLSVIEWALYDNMDSGRALATSYIYEIVSLTMNKVTQRMRQIVVARNDQKLDDEQRAVVDETLVSERQSMRKLFTAIETACLNIAERSNVDEMDDGIDGGISDSERDYLVAWAERWTRAWRRRAAVEEAAVGEAAVQAGFELEVEKARIKEAEEQAAAEAKQAEIDMAAATAAAVARNGGDANGNGDHNGNGVEANMEDVDDIS